MIPPAIPDLGAVDSNHDDPQGVDISHLIDRTSDAGSWDKALRYPNSILQVSDADVVRELARATAAMQLRTIETVLGFPANQTSHSSTTADRSGSPDPDLNILSHVEINTDV